MHAQSLRLLATIFVHFLAAAPRVTSMVLASSSATKVPSHPSIVMIKRPIVYTLAGSDSGGGAGIQADLLAIHSMSCHGCSAITCLTAQNSLGVTSVHTPPTDFWKAQLETLLADLPPVAIKIGMLGSKELVQCVAESLAERTDNGPVCIVMDPVMISTSGHRLIEQDAQQAMVDSLFPLVHLVTPNKFETEALLGRTVATYKDVEQAARDLLAMGARSVLIKGGHSQDQIYSHDYFLAAADATLRDDDDEPRLCDSTRGVWLRSPRYPTDNTHGTGCTLSSAIASAWALGETERRQPSSRRGSYSSIELVDACCLAKAYVTSGIAHGAQLGKGPGPVAQTSFPSSYEHFPTIVQDPTQESLPFRPMAAHGAVTDCDLPRLGRILPIVDTVEWVRRLCETEGVEDIQLRIKGEASADDILIMVKEAQALCRSAKIRLWINDYWDAAVEAGCFGVHVGQEDLLKCMENGGLDVLRDNNLALGISTHSFAELAAALGVRPTYISLGPVFATTSKTVRFDPQGVGTVAKWRELTNPDIPLVAIGGIGDAEITRQVKLAGADCVAVINAVTKPDDIVSAVAALNIAMTG